MIIKQICKLNESGEPYRVDTNYMVLEAYLIEIKFNDGKTYTVCEDTLRRLLEGKK
jgi:hypothetical protein